MLVEAIYLSASLDVYYEVKSSWHSEMLRAPKIHQCTFPSSLMNVQLKQYFPLDN